MNTEGTVLPSRVDAQQGTAAGQLSEDNVGVTLAAAPPAGPAAPIPGLPEQGDTPQAVVARLEQRVADLRQRHTADPACERLKSLLAVTLVDLGTNLKFCGRSPEGVQRYIESLQYNPDYCAAYYNLGVSAAEGLKIQEALQHYDNALRCNPLCVEALCNVGVLKRQLGELQEACRYYERALRVRPNLEVCTTNYAAALSDLGTHHQNEGRPLEAVALYKKALLMSPHYADAYYNLGVAYSCLKGVKKNYMEKAIYYYSMAVHFRPAYAEAWNNLGVVYKLKGAVDRSVQCYEKALELNPTLVQTMNNLAVLVSIGGQMDRAQNLLRRALTLAPNYAEAHNNLGVVLRDEGVMQEALECYGRCLTLCPDAENAAQNRLLALNFSTESTTDEVQAAHLEWGARISAKHNPNGEVLFAPSLAARLCREHPEACSSAGFSEAGWRESLPAPGAPAEAPPGAVVVGGRYPFPAKLLRCLKAAPRLRIGYVSPDFCLHSVSYFTHNLLQHHRRDEVEVVCFSNTLRHDAKTCLFKNLAGEGNWVDITGKDMAESCRLISERGIDILVDLTGHTSTNRLDIFLRRPAPIQVTWIGYPNTTGLREIDYRFTDEQADPYTLPGIEGHYAETLYRLPDTFLCYCPDTASTDGDAPSKRRRCGEQDAEVSQTASGGDVGVGGIGSGSGVAAEGGGESDAGSPDEGHGELFVTMNKGDVKPVIPEMCALQENGYLTFGTFNNMAKVNGEVLDVWAEILRRLPTSRLFLKSKPFAEARVREMFAQKLVARGVDRSRMDLVGIIPQHYNHLQAYEKIDVALDCWPYAGTTTTCEALWMGKPVVTLRGDRHATNVGASLLTSVKCPELIASTKDEYISIALSLADVPRLQRYQKNLQSSMARSVLCNGPQFVINVEQAYRNMWTAFCEGRKHIQEAPKDQAKEPSQS